MKNRTSEPFAGDRHWIQQILKSVRGLSERSQRAMKVVEALIDRSPEEVVEFLHYLIRPLGEEPLCRRLHLDLLSHRETLRRFSYEQIASIYEVASKQEKPEIQALFRFTPPRWIEGEEKPEGFARKLDSLTLGERKQMSRQVERRNLEMLIFDESPQVISSLLMNPKLRSSDVVRLASRRGAPGKVLEEVCLSKRWNGNYSVRKALVFNPSTPPVYSLGFVVHLNVPDLRLLLQKGRISPEMARMTERLIAERAD